MKKKGFTLVELMVVIAIIAILAAVALPIYSTFKQKARASTAVKGAMGTTQALQTHFDDSFTLANVVLNPAAPGRGEGAAFIDTGINVGSGLPAIEGVQWTINAAATTLVINWTHDKCNGTDCDGKMCLLCDANTDSCEIAIDVTAGSNKFGLDKGDITICP